MEAGLKKNIGPVCVSNIQKLIARRLVKLGLRDVNHDPDSNRSRKDVKVCHGFRKFFTNQCINSELLTERRWLLEGHNLKANDNNYVRQNPNQLLTEYMKAVDNLTIDPSQRMARKIQSLEVEKTQIQALALELEKVKRMMAKKK